MLRKGAIATENQKSNLKNAKTWFIDATFKVALWKAIQSVFPQTSIRGCYFHWTQAVFKHITENGLKDKYSSVETIRNTQNTRTPLKTGSEQSVKLLFIGQWNFDPFQMDQPKTRLIST